MGRERTRIASKVIAFATVLAICTGLAYWRQARVPCEAIAPAQVDSVVILPSAPDGESAMSLRRSPTSRSSASRTVREDAGSVEPLPLAVSPTTTAGTVVDVVTGHPLWGARVVSLDTSEELAVSDEAGRFTVECGDLPYRLVTVSHRDYMPTLFKCSAGRDVVVPMSHGAHVSGVLYQAVAGEGATPLAGRTLRVRQTRPRRVRSNSYQTGADGSFAFLASPLSTLKIEVLSDGKAPWVELLAVPTDSVEHDIVISADSIEVDVLVTDQATGLPLEASAVTCGGTLVGRTEDCGVVSILLFPDQLCEVRASKLGYVDRSDRVKVSAEGEIPLIQLELVPEARLDGVVSDLQGRPVSGARVELEIARTGLGRKRFLGVNGQPSGVSTTTDSDGVFAFAGLGSNYGKTRARVIVRHAGFATHESEFIDIPNGHSAALLRCLLVAGATLRGTVTVDGLPARATVMVDGNRDPAQTNRLGAYEIEGVGRGTCSAVAFLDPMPEIRKRVDIRVPASGVLELNFKLDYTMEVVQGTVSSPLGEPVSGVRVHCEVEAPELGRPRRYSTTSDATGFYALSIPTLRDRQNFRCKILLRRWMEDVEVEGVRPPATVNLEARATGTVVFSTVIDVPNVEQAYIEVLWEARNRAKGLPEQEPIACEDRQDLAFSRVSVVVPAGEGTLVLRSYGFLDRRLPVSLVSGAVVDLGRVELERLSEDE